jgi:hypothetical protein
VRASRDSGHGGLARVLEGFGLGRGVLWVGAGEGRVVGDVQNAGKKRGGSWVLLSRLLPFSRLGSGLGALGSTAASPRSMATVPGRARTVIITVKQDFARFHLPGVRRNARKKFKFEFLKFSTLGDQHICQGFQWYFCFTEMLSFAEILFAFLSMVTVSDSNFGSSLSNVLI